MQIIILTSSRQILNRLLDTEHRHLIGLSRYPTLGVRVGMGRGCLCVLGGGGGGGGGGGLWHFVVGVCLRFMITVVVKSFFLRTLFALNLPHHYSRIRQEDKQTAVFKENGAGFVSFIIIIGTLVNKLPGPEMNFIWQMFTIC